MRLLRMWVPAWGRREKVRESNLENGRDGYERVKKRPDVVLIPMAIEEQTIRRAWIVRRRRRRRVTRRAKEKGATWLRAARCGQYKFINRKLTRI